MNLTMARCVCVGAFAVMISALCLFATPAFADGEGGEMPMFKEEYAKARSSADTGWDFDFVFNGTCGTDWRSKDNDTSAYIYVQYKYIDRYMVYIDGSDNSSGTNRVACTDYGSATVWKAGEFQIWNHVKEWGKSYAQLTGWANYEGGHSYGLWSPDSVGSYPIINNY